MRILLAWATLSMGLTAGNAALAQDEDAASGKWDVMAYVLGASMDGSTGVAPLTADVDLGFDDILENLEFGAMGRVRAARDPWSVTLDVIYMGLGASGDQPAFDVDVDQTAIELAVGFKYNDHFESIVGARYIDLSVDLRFQGPLGLQSSPSVDWYDPFIGANIHAPLGERWSLSARADIGGFGVGSDLTWQIETLFDWHLSERTSFQMGYRWIDIDYEDDGFVYDMLTQGPQAGVTWRF